MRLWGWRPHDRISVLLRRRREIKVLFLSPLCEDMTGRWPFAIQEESPHWGTKSAGTLILYFLELWEINSYCWSHPVYSIFLWQLELIQWVSLNTHTHNKNNNDNSHKKNKMIYSHDVKTHLLKSITVLGSVIQWHRLSDTGFKLIFCPQGTD